MSLWLLKRGGIFGTHNFRKSLSKRETLQILPIFSLDINFKNLTIESHILYILNTHVKICSKINVIYY